MLLQRLDDPEMVACAQRKALSVVPEFCVKDMAQWFRFLAGHILRLHPNTVKGLDVSTLLTHICIFFAVEFLEFVFPFARLLLKPHIHLMWL